MGSVAFSADPIFYYCHILKDMAVCQHSHWQHQCAKFRSFRRHEGMPPYEESRDGGVKVSSSLCKTPQSLSRQLLAAARSRSGSDSPPDCHSLPSRRFATPGLSFTPPATASLFTTANAFPRETLPRTNGIPEQSASSWRSESH